MSPYKRLALSAALIAAPHIASAFDAKLTADTVESVESALKSASRVLAAKAEKATSAQDIVTAAKADYRQLTSTLYSFGYYGGVIHIYVDGREASQISPLDVPAQVSRVDIKVEGGPLFRFGQADVGPLARGTAIPEAFKQGAPARLGAIQDAGRAAIDAWRAASYAKADITGERVVARHPARRLDVDLRVTPGPALTFGQLEIGGNKDVRSERIRAIAGLPTGKAFTPDDVETSARRLRRTGAFRSVILREADTPNPDGTLDITAQLVEEKPRRFGFGAEISSFEGVKLTGFWMHRNLFGGAERFRVDGEVAGLGSNTGTDYKLSGRISRPATFWTDTTAYIEANVALLDEPDFYSKQAGFEFGLEAIITDQLSASAGIGYRFSDVRDDLGERSFSHIILPVSLEWDRRDNALDAHNGTYLDAEAMPFIGVRGSSTGARAYADARAYRGFGLDSRFVLAGRVQAGSVFGSALADTPPDLLFHSGGGGTVRGQPYQSLAVDLGGGDRVGGRSFLGASAELRAGVSKNISVVGFYDVGWIGAGSVPGDGDMHAGAGIGLRYATGIGPIRLDVAKPVAGSTGDGYQIYVGIGQAF